MRFAMKRLLSIALAFFSASTAHAQLGGTTYFNGATRLGTVNVFKADGVTLTCTLANGAVTCQSAPGVSIGNWTFSGNDADLTGAGQMGIGNIGPTATSIGFGPNLLTLRSTGATTIRSLSTTVPVTIFDTNSDLSGSGAAQYEFRNNGNKFATLWGQNFSTTHLQFFDAANASAMVNFDAKTDNLTCVGHAGVSCTFTATTSGASGGFGTSASPAATDWSSSYSGVDQSLGFSATPNFNCSGGSGETIQISVTGNITGATFSGGNKMEHCTIIFSKDNTANTYTIVFTGANVHSQGTITMSATANSWTVVPFAWNSQAGTPAWFQTNTALNQN